MGIMVGTCRERFAYWENIDSVAHAQRYLAMHDISTGSLVGTPTYIHEGRQRIVDMFMEVGDATHLCFVDSDNVLPEEALWALLQRDLPIVGALYFGRINYPEVIAKDFTNDEWSSRSVSQKVREMILEHNLPVANIPQCIADAPLLKVDVIGFGCTMIKRAVLEDMTDKYGKLFGGHGANIGEDVSFCKLAKSSGYDVYLDLGVQLGHLKTYGVTVGDFMNIPEWVTGD